MKLNFSIPWKKRERFEDLFHNIHEINLTNGTQIHMRALRIRDSDFMYHELVSELSNIVTHFCLSRLTIKNYQTESRDGELQNEATKKLVDYERNDGEAGELLLYSFLEAHLGAPKILSKVELKTSSQDYVKGSDGVHLLDLGNGDFHLIFCESKLDHELTTSLREAFKGINKFKTREKNNLNDEVILVNNMLGREEYDQKKYHVIKEILFPKKVNGTYRDNAFAIFAGFNLEITNEEKELPSKKLEILIHEKLKKMCIEKERYILDKIKEYDLGGHCFYIYLFPFTRLEKVRKGIIENLTKHTNVHI